MLEVWLAILPDTIRVVIVIPSITTQNEAISPTEIFRVRNKPYQFCTNYTTKSSLQILYKSVAIFHEYVHYITKYNVLSTSGNCFKSASFPSYTITSGIKF